MFPTLGESVTEATVANWLKSRATRSTPTSPVELETDKVTVEVPAPAAGVLSNIRVKAGETVAVGGVLGAIAKATAPPRRSRSPWRQAAAAPAAATDAGRRQAQLPPSRSRRRVRGGRAREDPTLMPSAARHAPRSTASTPSTVAGTGKDGRVTKGDVLAALEARATAARRAEAPRRRLRAARARAKSACR